MSWNVGQVVNLSVDADEDDTRLDRWLKRKFHGLTQGQIEKACRTGEIRVDGARAKANTRVKAGQTVRIPPMTAAKGREGEDEDDKPRARVKSSDADMMRSLVIYEDDQIIALNKPSGLAVQGGTGTTRHIDALSRALVRRHGGEAAPRPPARSRHDRRADPRQDGRHGQPARPAVPLARARQDLLGRRRSACRIRRRATSAAG